MIKPTSIETFRAQVRAFREHARKLKAQGFQHVSVKHGQSEFHVEGVGPVQSEHVGSGIPIGFDYEDDSGKGRK